jgi:hypothetical protein
MFVKEKIQINGNAIEQEVQRVDNPFDPERLRISQDFAAAVGVKKALLTVPVRKPDRQSFIRVNPDSAYRLEVAMLELKDDREIFVVEPSLINDLPGEVSARLLLATINRQGVIFLWPARLPNPEGGRDEWSRSALEAAELAQKGWVRVVANMSLGAYEVFQATGNLPEPEWPDISFTTLLEIAFRDKFIRSLDDPAVKKLRGAL